jgi:branched-chain amino acid transport system ATP-binding protein
MSLLEVTDLHVAYGKIEAVKGISFTVDAGEVVTLIGGNGAGKTTTLRTLSGLLRPTSGSIVFEGVDITSTPAHAIVAKGIAQSPEGRRIFPRLSVAENLELGAFIRRDTDGIRSDQERIFSLFPVLQERSSQAAGTLSGGEQQMLAMGRALMSRPKLLMLDEPSLGLAPLIVKDIFHIIERLRETGVATLLIEQNARAALQVADYGYVLETGDMVLEGAASDLAQNPKVIETYLGFTKKAEMA